MNGENLNVFLKYWSIDVYSQYMFFVFVWMKFSLEAQNLHRTGIDFGIMATPKSFYEMVEKEESFSEHVNNMYMYYNHIIHK